MSIQQNFPSTRPSLSINFARSQRLDPRITFTRTTSGTRTNSDGLIEVVPANSPRFDFDPVTGESLGLLVEEQRTNLLLRSEEFNISPWGGITTGSSASISVDSTTSPNGTITADTFVPNLGTTITGNGNFHNLRQFISVANGTTYTLSVYVKSAGYNILRFGISSQNNLVNNYSDTTVNLQTVSVTQTLGSGTITPVGNGWYRITSTGITSSENAYAVFVIADGGTADGTSGIYIWGAQLEQGSFPTSYIPTTTSTVTRTADNASITGSNFSDFYNPSEGTIYTVFRKSLGTQTNQYPFAISDNTVDNRFTLFTSGSSTLNFRLSSSGSSFNPSTLSFTAGEPIKASIASAVGTNQSIASSTGVLSTPGSPTSMPLVDRMYVGGAHSGLEKLNGTISQLIYYPSRLPNDQLITLTK
jgi:hypothetical protein